MKVKEFSTMLQKLRNVEYRLTKEFEDKTGFSITRYQILVYISEQGDSLQTDIAKFMEIDPAAVTRHLKILEEKGYVTRTRNAKNAREVIVSLTDFAKAELAKCQERSKDAEPEIALPLDSQDIQAVMDVLAMVESRFS